jgi:hypothetical protein
MTRSTDFTGIAYLTALGLAAAVAFVVYRKSASIGQAAGEVLGTVQGAATRVLDAVNPASQGNIANTSANAVASSITGRETSIGSLFADWWPSAAERTVNSPGFWNGSPGYLDPAATPYSGFDDWTQDFAGGDLPPAGAGYVGTLPKDESRPAIIYRAPRRLQ